MPPILYMTEMSPPSRAVMLTIEELALDVEIINMDFRSNDHLKPDFIKVGNCLVNLY